LTGRLAVTVDVEDWYHIPSVTGSPFSVYRDVEEFYSKWSGRYDYLSEPTRRVLTLLDEYDVKATFFVVADIVNRYPGLVESIADHGHEIACHGLQHSCKIDPKTKKPLMSVEEFKERTIKAKRILEDATNQQVIGYRAPNALVGGWMLEELPSLGFRYDSSISMNSIIKKHDLLDSEITTKPFNIQSNFWEYPMAYFDILGFKLPTSGGPWLRFLGEKIHSWGIKQSLRRGDTVFYFHPLDVSYANFPTLGNKRPFYWSIKGKLVENRIKTILNELIRKQVIIKTIKELLNNT
jgi:peptidoglycan-N-acetylglucosamine deacetylase